jgi:hypothetical protein
VQSVFCIGQRCSADVHDNASSITGGITGVEVNAGTITQLYHNNISSNTGDGVRVLTGGKINLLQKTLLRTTAAVLRLSLMPVQWVMLPQTIFQVIQVLH